LLDRYFSLTGRLLRALRAAAPDARPVNRFTAEAVFGGGKDEQAAGLRALTEWLSANAPAARWRMVPAHTRSLAPDCVRKLEEVVRARDEPAVEREFIGVEADALVWPEKHGSEGTGALPKRGQRVVALTASGAVPFGAPGTVVSVDKQVRMVTVLFDDVLPCGTKLEGRLETNRGLQLHARDLMNL
jgi:hypothetical protein